MTILDNPDEWPPDSTGSVFLARALAELPHDVIWKGLKSGELESRVYCVGRTDWGPVPISSIVRLLVRGARSRSSDELQDSLQQSATIHHLPLPPP
jgi:hypothetical protein